MEFDYSWEAVSNPGSSQHYFQFNPLSSLTIRSPDFNIHNACLLAELCRLSYRTNTIVYSQNTNISIFAKILSAAGFELLDEFTNLETSTMAYLLKAKANDAKTQQTTECLILVFRGTTGFDNWKFNINAIQTTYYTNAKAHTGFYDAYKSIEDKILQNEILKTLPVIITGHSLGAAMAIHSILPLVEQNILIDSCYTMGSPKPGDEEFANYYSNYKIYRVINRNDIVTMLPFNFLNTSYAHCGESHYFTEDEHYIGKTDSEILKLQTNELPQLEQIQSLEAFRHYFKNSEKEVPSYFSDHAPVNYLARLELFATNKSV